MHTMRTWVLIATIDFARLAVKSRAGSSKNLNSPYRRGARHRASLTVQARASFTSHRAAMPRTRSARVPTQSLQ